MAEKRVTAANITAAKELYDKLPGWKFANKVLTDFFKKNNKNNDKKIVLTKVCLLDSLYGTYLMDQIGMAEHIVEIKGIDALLKKGSEDAANKISQFNGKKFISFTSKYCHFHNKAAYPIYDSYARSALKKLSNWKGEGYMGFWGAINEFRISNDLKWVSNKDLDKYLWLFGQGYALRKGKTKINKEVKSLYEGEKDLFKRLLL